MAAFYYSIEIHANRNALFDLTQDYNRRLEWDPFLKVACLQDGAKAAGLGARAWCVAKNGLGMETEYITFNPPCATAVKMTRGPAILKSFAGSWRFEEISLEKTRVIFRYNLVARPGWMRAVIEPILSLVFSRDTRNRLQALKHKVETTNILKDQIKP
jgi:ribosome-associated toxin RatA of RatAB toxin-antitoxin module